MKTSSRNSTRNGALAALVALTAVTGCATLSTEVALPGAGFYPESVSVGKGGRLYVGSLGSGAIIAVDPAAPSHTETVVPAGSAKGFTGVHVDEGRGDLWACAVDVTQRPPATEVRRYALATRALIGTYAFAGPAFCNDLAIDGDGSLFVSDSFGKIWRLGRSATALAVWTADAQLAPASAAEFGANGLALDGHGNLYVNTNTAGRLFRIAINSDGTAGTVMPITVSPALVSPDGMRMLNEHALVVAENQGRLVRVELTKATGSATALASNLRWPTSVALSGGHAWVTEGQLGNLLGLVQGPPVLPFYVRRVDLP